MPCYLKVETNTRIPEEKTAALSRALAASVSGVIAVPPQELHVELAGGRRMRMAHTDEPIAHVEIKGIEFPKNRAAELTAAICPLLDQHLAIHDNRIYIAVISNRNSMWRVNGDNA